MCLCWKRSFEVCIGFNFALKHSKSETSLSLLLFIFIYNKLVIVIAGFVLFLLRNAFITKHYVESLHLSDGSYKRVSKWASEQVSKWASEYAIHPENPFHYALRIHGLNEKKRNSDFQLKKRKKILLSVRIELTLSSSLLQYWPLI